MTTKRNDYPLIANLLSELSLIGAEIRSLRVENDQLRAEKATSNRKKLSRGDVAQIHELNRQGKSQAEIASIYDINPATVSRTLRGIYNK